MQRLPLGISQLDAIIDGGAPAGSVILLAGESGAGAREFCFTSAIYSALLGADRSTFELYYGELPEHADPVSDVHYVSFTDEPETIIREMGFVLDGEIVNAAGDAITFADFSKEYFQLTPVPPSWYTERMTDITKLADRNDRDDVLDRLGEYLSENGAGSLIVIDSLTDLIATEGERLSIADLTLLLKGLSRASHHWGGIILVLVTTETVSERTLGHLKEAVDGTFRFTWESGGAERTRTLVVEEFRGVLARLEDENIVQFETEITDAGFDITNVRKIR